MCVGVQSGHSGDGCELASTLCRYDLRKGDLFFWVGQGCDGFGRHECLLLFATSCCSE